MAIGVNWKANVVRYSSLATHHSTLVTTHHDNLSGFQIWSQSYRNFWSSIGRPPPLLHLKQFKPLGRKSRYRGPRVVADVHSFYRTRNIPIIPPNQWLRPSRQQLWAILPHFFLLSFQYTNFPWMESVEVPWFLKVNQEKAMFVFSQFPPYRMFTLGKLEWLTSAVCVT
jgi:hypothetical protein